MKIHGDNKTPGDKIILELKQFIRGCEKQTVGFEKLSGDEKLIARNAWSREFLRGKGLIEKPAEGNQEAEK
jgi:hypothetical protein